MPSRIHLFHVYGQEETVEAYLYEQAPAESRPGSSKWCACFEDNAKVHLGQVYTNLHF
jgi:hypothetical protein